MAGNAHNMENGINLAASQSRFNKDNMLVHPVQPRQRKPLQDVKKNSNKVTTNTIKGSEKFDIYFDKKQSVNASHHLENKAVSITIRYFYPLQIGIRQEKTQIRIPLGILQDRNRHHVLTTCTPLFEMRKMEEHPIEEDMCTFSEDQHHQILDSLNIVSSSRCQDDVPPSSDLLRSSSQYQSAMDSHSEFVTAEPISAKTRHEELIEAHPEYVTDIYRYMRHLEKTLRPRANYMRKQSDINEEMRTILVDWLADVTAEYDLLSETLHMAVSIVDRVLSFIDCPRLKLQLIGSTAMMISAKFEEIYPPELKDFVYITDDTYTAQQVLRMERVVLDSLRFTVCAPTSNWFAARLARTVRLPRVTRQLSQYLLELALLDYSILQFRASVVAAAALCLANIMTGLTPWSDELEMESGISLIDLYPAMHTLLSNAQGAASSKHRAVFDKYSGAKQGAVALLPVPESLPSIV